MTTVATVLRSRGGRYGPEWVRRLAAGLRRHLPRPYRLVCLTDVPDAVADVAEPIPLRHDWPGWWSKLELFREDVSVGRMVYLDLDTVITGDVSRLIDDTAPVIMLEDMVHKGTVSTALMAWDGPLLRGILDRFLVAPGDWMRGVCLEAAPNEVLGDQVFVGDALRALDLRPSFVQSRHPLLVTRHDRSLDDPGAAPVHIFIGSDKPNVAGPRIQAAWRAGAPRPFSTVADRAEAAIVVGTGPSLGEVDLEALARSPAAVVAVNGAIEHLPRVDHWVSIDPSEINLERIRKPRPGTRYWLGVDVTFGTDAAVPAHHREMPGDHVALLRRRHAPRGLVADRWALPDSNSGVAGLNLAAHLGARRIALFGFDARGGYWGRGGAPADLSRMVPALDEAARLLGRAGIEVVNGSPWTAIDTFPVRPTDEALAWVAGGRVSPGAGRR